MPKDGPAILEGIVNKSGKLISQANIEAAKSELNGQINKWVTDLYSSDKSTRITAYNAMVNSNVSPERIATPLIKWTQNNLHNKNGVFNAMTYLNSKSDPASTFQIEASTLKEIAEKAKMNGENTSKVAKEIILKLD